MHFSLTTATSTSETEAKAPRRSRATLVATALGLELLACIMTNDMDEALYTAHMWQCSFTPEFA